VSPRNKSWKWIQLQAHVTMTLIYIAHGLKPSHWEFVLPCASSSSSATQHVPVHIHQTSTFATAPCPPQSSQYGPLASEATSDSLKNVLCCFGGSIDGVKESMVSTRSASQLGTGSDTASSVMTDTTRGRGVGSVTAIGAGFGDTGCSWSGEGSEWRMNHDIERIVVEHDCKAGVVMWQDSI
jgi:hypothetical protein